MSVYEQQKKPVAVTTETYNWLKAYISSLPRDKGVFLTESEVAEATGASRTPVREAIMRLEAEGLLERIPRRGAFVPSLSDEEIRMVMEARNMIELWAIEECMSSDKIDLDELGALMNKQIEAWGDPKKFISLDRDFHARIVAGAGNSAVSQFYEELRDRQLRMGVYAVTASKDRASQVVEEHRQIVDALRSSDVEQGRNATTLHLSHTTEAMLRKPKQP